MRYIGAIGLFFGACIAPAGSAGEPIYEGEEITEAPVAFIVGAGRGSGVIVYDRWVLTALHVVPPAACDSSTVPPIAVLYRAPGDIFWTSRVYADGVVCHRSLDVALLHLDAPIHIEIPAAWSRSTPQGRLTCVGYGDVGSGFADVDRILAIYPTAASLDVDRNEEERARLIRVGDGYAWSGDSGGGCFRASGRAPWILEGVISQGECGAQRATWIVRSDAIADWVFDTTRRSAAPVTRQAVCDFGCQPACEPGWSCAVHDGQPHDARCVEVGSCLPLVELRPTQDQILVFGGDVECAMAYARASCSARCGAGAETADVERVRECMRRRCQTSCAAWPDEPLCSGCALLDGPFCDFLAWQRSTTSALGSACSPPPSGCD
ncbi:MAG: trypsin-like peptidase domain-containing protein [Sandaracinaceae bacterium]|nr:trypsin-like peptidase domain-containing protein [Sandaracinaceae bacterium]